MAIFDNIKAGEITNAHGEVNFFRITDGKANLAGFTDVSPVNGRYVVGHSEQGHHHVLEADGVLVKERVSEGMKILHAIVSKPVALRQEAGVPHAEQTVQPGDYIITNNIEYDPFAEQARRVMD